MGKFLKKMGKLPFIVEHVTFNKTASLLQIPKKMGKFPKNRKIPKKMGKFLFIAEHVDGELYLNSYKNGKIPIKRENS